MFSRSLFVLVVLSSMCLALVFNGPVAVDAGSSTTAGSTLFVFNVVDPGVTSAEVTLPANFTFKGMGNANSFASNTFYWNTPAPGLVWLFAQAARPLADQTFGWAVMERFASSNVSQSFNTLVRAPHLNISNLTSSSGAIVLRNEKFYFNISVENIMDAQHTGNISTSARVTMPTIGLDLFSAEQLVASGSTTIFPITTQPSVSGCNIPVSFLASNLLEYADEEVSQIDVISPVISVRFFNDSAYTIPATDFRPGDTVYYSIYLNDTCNNQPIDGTLSVVISSKHGNEGTATGPTANGLFNGSYVLGAAAASDAWTIAVTETLSSASGSGSFNVIPSIGALTMYVCPTLPCDASGLSRQFVPGDSIYINVTAYDQVGDAITQSFSADVVLSNSTGGAVNTYSGAANSVFSLALNDTRYSTYGINLTAYNSYSSNMTSQSIATPVMISTFSLAPGSPYNYGRTLTGSFQLTNAAGTPTTPTASQASLYDDGVVYQSAANVTSFTFTIGGTNNVTETQSLSIIAVKDDMNASMGQNLSIVSYLNASLILTSASPAVRGNTLSFIANVSWADSSPYAGLSFALNLTNAAETILIPMTDNGDGTYSASYALNWSAPIGTWNATVSVIDAYNNTGSAYTTAAVVPASLVLSAGLSVPDGWRVNGENFDVFANVTRGGALLAGAMVNYTLSDATSGPFTDVGSGLYSATLNKPAGAYTMTVNADDGYGNTGQLNYSFIVLTRASLTQTVIAPSQINDNTRFLINVTLNNTGEGYANCTSRVTLSSGSLVVGTSPVYNVFANGTVSFLWEVLAETDTVTVTVNTTYQYGSVENMTSVDTLAVPIYGGGGGGSGTISSRQNATETNNTGGSEEPADTTAPVVMISGPEEGRTYDSGNVVLLLSYSDENSVRCYYDIGSGYSSMLTSGGSASAALTLSDRRYDVSFRCVDEYNNEWTGSTYFWVATPVQTTTTSSVVINTNVPNSAPIPTESSESTPPVTMTGQFVLGNGLALGAALFVGAAVFLAGQRMLQPYVRKHYPIYGNKKWYE